MSHYKTGHKQPRFRYSVLARCVAWANISVQVLFPLAVTFTPVMAARAQHAVQPRLSMGNTTVTADNNVEKNVASFAANAGTFLSSQPDSDATRNFITGMATAKANQEIQEWLGKYGTARVKLNVDKNFSLKDSSLEMLYPIYDTPTNMLFTQGAIHRTDDRTQSNIGFGWRHFSGNDWMAGVNTFIDHDLSRSHTRIGVGAEYWRDYLKLSANGYIRASGWKKSPDVEDYQERPANGWDIRAEGYLPAWPQLGASLMYEQYYGDEVGLFGKDKRQKDPHAISAEVTYTPVPLLTLSAGHKQGKSGENDTRFGLEVNYRITLMAGVNPVGGSMWVDIEAPEGVTEKDYQFLPSKADHFSGGKITRTFSTSKPGVYTFTFNALTYGGYEMTPVKVTINAVAAETENGEEEMP